MQYRRAKNPGSSYSFTLVTHNRRSILCEPENIDLLRDCPDDVFIQMAGYFYPIFTRKYRDIVESLLQSSASASMHGKKALHAAVQSACNDLFTQIRLYSKGIDVGGFNEEEKKSLEKHLLRTLATDLANTLFWFFKENANVEDIKKTLDRVAVIADAANPAESAALSAINKALQNAPAVDDFLDVFETQAAKAADVFIKKADKKKERQVLFNQRQAILAELEACQEAALALHLTVLIVFQAQTQNVVHISGKFVPIILQRISSQMADEDAKTLFEFQEMIMRNQGEDAISNFLPKVKQIALASKKKS